MLDWTQCAAVERSPDKVSGAWLFVGTRVPVKALFENLECGACLGEFLEWFPGVTRQQAEAVMKQGNRDLEIDCNGGSTNNQVLRGHNSQ